MARDNLTEGVLFYHLCRQCRDDLLEICNYPVRQSVRMVERILGDWVSAVSPSFPPGVSLSCGDYTIMATNPTSMAILKAFRERKVPVLDYELTSARYTRYTVRSLCDWPD